MKKIILSALAIFTIGFVNAQKVAFGLKGGLNIANENFKGTGAPSTSALIGVNVGAFVEFEVADKLSLQPEVLYSTQGTNLNYKENGTTLNSFKLDYIIIPVMLKYHAAEKFTLEFGPQVGFLTSAMVNGTASGVTVDVDAKQFYKSTDFGLNVGAGFDITKKVAIGARYNFGLANIGSSSFVNNGDTIKNSVFSINLSVKL
jgi:hypothetical protein